MHAVALEAEKREEAASRSTCCIGAYVRISVDDDLSGSNLSIETQKQLIAAYVEANFPGAALSFYEDRDLSGYTFETRPGYQKMRKNLGTLHDIMIVNDLSRFSRRNGRGLVELEDLRDMGIRIISLAERIDYPAKDDWLQIQIHFFVNEMPVTQTSSKVRRVIEHRQKMADWICAVPYGYQIAVEQGKNTIQPDPVAVPIVRLIFQLYNDGWGYNKIARYLSEQHYPTPRMREKERIESEGRVYQGKVSARWNLVSVSHVINNDFYIGTLRQRKYKRTTINGSDKRVDRDEHIVHEKHHEAIIDEATYARAQRERAHRDKSGYRGIKKYENPYSGLMFCGDCGAPMFAMSRKNLTPAYTCGTYHRQATKGCTSHHTRVDTLDRILKAYLLRVREHAGGMLTQLEEAIKGGEEEAFSGSASLEAVETLLTRAKAELKETQRLKIRAIAKNPAQEALLEETYQEMEAELFERIAGYQNQLQMMQETQGNMFEAKRRARGVLDVFDAILEKESLSKLDIRLIAERIDIFKDHIAVKLHADIDRLLGAAGGEMAANFSSDSVNISSRLLELMLSVRNQRDKVCTVHAINRGSPSRIRIVRRISFGMTTRPRSSIRRTMPVAFIISNSPLR